MICPSAGAPEKTALYNRADLSIEPSKEKETRPEFERVRLEKRGFLIRLSSLNESERRATEV